MKPILGALIFSLFYASRGALACATCDVAVSKDWQTQGIASHPGFAAEISYDYADQSQMRLGGSAASPAAITRTNLSNGLTEAEVRTRNSTTNLGLDYAAENWGLTMKVPFLDRYHTTYPGGFGTPLNTSHSRTVGDSRLVGRYTGFSPDQSSGILFGVKLPTGPISVNFADGTPLDRSLQPGTASTDMIGGGYKTGSVGLFGWFMQATVQHAISTRGDFRPGDTYALNGGIRYASFGQAVVPMLQLNFIHRERDTGVNAVAVYSGGNIAYLAPGISVRIGGGMTAYGFLQLPVYQYVNGLQLTPTSTLSLGLRQTF